ncbi:hypothetical protein TPHA_0B03540 [Tetrapisispora phaffii CBS 4417]|uniref:WHIM1 domain-containing protein n=1 Tax=Tetrapisispora phaffii (strain ATCC 24235 / CBS 4417 / NBRC 1672 / NRRL Y-8282 / UCD 70-5) TaxID=1071381 RepID=G8BPU3_TETPH|nr:hypothetical protein TPHA_0B03540 [Tetrapisispora phaffii CBS 4417]CCE62024.1 hypothetical protein TPHA_0B03540 [Tetrapisispora phaffii CBS 4417]
MASDGNSSIDVINDENIKEVKGTIKNNKVIKPQSNKKTKKSTTTANSQKRQRKISDFQNVKTVHKAIRTNAHLLPNKIKGRATDSKSQKNAKSRGKNSANDDNDENDDDDSDSPNGKKDEKVDITMKNELFHFHNILQPDFEKLNLKDSVWSSNVALNSSDFLTADKSLHNKMMKEIDNPNQTKEQDNYLSFLKNMKSVSYAGDIVKIMSFINKFYNVFDPELLDISYQDFEIGLDLYPEATDNDGQEIKKYSDYIDTKIIIECEDKMNLIFLTTLKLLLVNLKTDNQLDLHRPYASFANLKTKEVFTKLVRGMRQNALNWGLPKEWREFIDSDKNILDKNDPDESDLKNNSSNDNLNDSLETDPTSEIINIPLFNMQLGKTGIFAIEPKDRIILLKTLVNWCISYSTRIHNEIYRLSHIKESEFGLNTQHVSRLMLEGYDLTTAQFYKLCKLVELRYENKLKRIKSRKPMTEEKQQEFDNKLKILKEIQKQVEKSPKEDQVSTNISFYNEWLEIFAGDFQSNPLSDPFEDSNRLRSQEFFIGRLPQLGDFYLPILSTYYDPKGTIPPYTGARELHNYFKKFSTNNQNSLSKFKNIEKIQVPQFKILFCNTSAIVQDSSKIEANTSIGSYWYEVCHDVKSLEIFIENISNSIENISKEIVKNKEKEDVSENCLFYAKLEIFRDFLKNIHSVFDTIETRKVEYDDISSTSRSLRSSKRGRVNYYDEDKDSAGDNEKEDENYADEDNLEEQGDEDDEDDEGLQNSEVYVKESRSERMLRRNKNRRK